MALSVIALFIYRHWLENQEDHYIHLHNDSHDSSIITTQTSMAKRLEIIDKAKNGLLIAVILYALAIAGMAIYSAWNSVGS
jgi:tellurite resistance protein TehA-like permease